MDSFLDKIIVQKKREIAALKEKSFRGRNSPKRDFVKALDKKPKLAIIAEIKKASPSKGLIAPDFDPVEIAEKYEQAGASAISVLTDENFFQGHAEYLVAARERTSLPVLRKDFIIDVLQVEETAHLGADALLLIAEALEPPQLADLYQAGRELDLDVLIELHHVRQLDKVMRVDPQLIGINNRDLATFAVSLSTTVEIIKHIPREVLVVSESGINTAADAETLRKAGVAALLVGESLMRAPDPAPLIKELQL
jgi:indole-3-glycerol phosphate synthase